MSESRARAIYAKVVLACLVVAVCIGVIIVFGRVQGVELDTNSLRMRTFWYYEMPLLQWPVTRRAYEIEETELSAFLRRERLVLLDREHWEFVSARSLWATGWDGEARQLYNYIYAPSHSHRLLAWSKDNPQVARIVWTKVMHAARRHHYSAATTMLKQALDTRYRSLDECETQMDALYEASAFPGSDGGNPSSL